MEGEYGDAVIGVDLANGPDCSAMSDGTWLFNPEWEKPDFDPAEDDKCPYCGSKEIYSDLVVVSAEDGSDEMRYDIIYCPQCKKRIWEESV
ncbi:MAG TPA: hypothetical protein DCZ10_09745 [Pelotomaculum sp.]|nr:hypothetical protein [Pelotomaculum sp.]